MSVECKHFNEPYNCRECRIEDHSRKDTRLRDAASELADALGSVLGDLEQGAIPNDLEFIRAALRAAGRL